MSSSGAGVKVHELRAENELRCEVGEKQTLTVRLLSGDGEIFGVEMAAGREYKFMDENLAIFTWYGCKVETLLCAADGTPGVHDDFYTADNTPMVAYVNTHSQLEARRDVAVTTEDCGPRVLVLGSEDSGKSTTARILAAYAARLDRTPMYVDLDLGESGFGGVAGSLVALPIEKCMLNVQEGFSTPLAPLVYFTGATSIKENSKHFQSLVSVLADKVNVRAHKDKASLSSGLIINTPKELASVDPAVVENLVHIVQALAVDVILCMDATGDRIFNKLTSLQGAKELPVSCTIVKLPSSKGLVQRDKMTRDRVRRAQIDTYFNGHRIYRGTKDGLSPHRMDLPLSKLVFVRVGGAQLSSAMRPIGSTEDTTLKLSVVRPSDALKSLVVAVLHPPTDGAGFGQEGTSAASNQGGDDVPPELVSCNVGGFMTIVDIDVEHDTLTVLAPCPTSLDTLPSKYLLIGSVSYID